MNIISISKQTSYSSNNRAKIPLSLIVFTLSIITLVSSNNAVFAIGVPYSITYDDNVVSNMPVDANDKTLNSTVSISSSIPTLSGKKFLGWCNSIPTTTDGIDSCSDTAYQPSSNLSIDQTGAGNNFHFYAMWGDEKTIANSTTMQEVNSCPASLPTGQIYTIKDSRDNTEYHTAKLADGKCWLLDNLALDLTNSTVLNGMNESNTNASNTTLGYLKGTTTRDPSTDANGQYATAGVTNWTSSGSYSAPLVNLTNKDVVPTDATSTAGGYKVGGYYNYCAASAGSYCYGNGRDYGTSSGNATEDICPKGWRMPGGNDTVNLTVTPPTGEYQNLYNNSSYNTSANYRSALRLPLSGYFSSGTVYEQGSYGYWWSSTRRYTDSMYILYAGTSFIQPARHDYRTLHYSVRCVQGS